MSKLPITARIKLPTQVVLNKFQNNLSLASKLTGISRTAFYPAIKRGYFGDIHSRRIVAFAPELLTYVEHLK